MNIKNRLAAIVAVPAGGVWLFDHFIANMPMVLEGGMVVAGIAATALGLEGCKKLLHSVTAEKTTEQEGQAASDEQDASEAYSRELPPAMTVRQVGQAPTQAQEVQEAFMRGAYAAMQRSRQGIER